MATRVGGRYRIWRTAKGNIGVLLCNGTDSPTDGRGSANRYEYFTQKEALRLAAKIIILVMKAKP